MSGLCRITDGTTSVYLWGAKSSFYLNDWTPALPESQPSFSSSPLSDGRRLVVNRWNVTLSGLVVPPDWSPGILGNAVAASYFPTLIEVAVAVGVLGYGLLAFTLGVKYLPLYPQPRSEAKAGD